MCKERGGRGGELKKVPNIWYFSTTKDWDCKEREREMKKGRKIKRVMREREEDKLVEKQKGRQPERRCVRENAVCVCVCPSLMTSTPVWQEGTFSFSHPPPSEPTSQK